MATDFSVGSNEKIILNSYLIENKLLILYIKLFDLIKKSILFKRNSFNIE